MNAQQREWVREAGLLPWTPARRKRQEHVDYARTVWVHGKDAESWQCDRCGRWIGP